MRPKLFGEAKTRKLDLLLSDDLLRELKAVADRHALAPASYARSLIVTHLNKIRAARDDANG